MEPATARPAFTVDSKIELSEKFFNEIISHPVPIDMNTLAALKRCSLGLDLYLWLVYRTFAPRKRSTPRGTIRATRNGGSRSKPEAPEEIVAARRSSQGLKAAAGADRSSGRGFETAGQTLGGGLQRDRRSVGRALNHIRQIE